MSVLLVVTLLVATVCGAATALAERRDLTPVVPVEDRWTS